MIHIKKPSPLVGKQANHFSRSGATLQKWVRRFALAKVAASAVGRGKLEQKRKKKQVWGKTKKPPLQSGYF